MLGALLVVVTGGVGGGLCRGLGHALLLGSPAVCRRLLAGSENARPASMSDFSRLIRDREGNLPLYRARPAGLPVLSPTCSPGGCSALRRHLRVTMGLHARQQDHDVISAARMSQSARGRLTASDSLLSLRPWPACCARTRTGCALSRSCAAPHPISRPLLQRAHRRCRQPKIGPGCSPVPLQDPTADVTDTGMDPDRHQADDDDSEGGEDDADRWPAAHAMTSMMTAATRVWPLVMLPR